MAQFNPAVTVGFMITRHIVTRIQVVYYFTAEIIGALFGSLFVKYFIGNTANLGTNLPNYIYPIPVIFGIEVMASALLMSVILIVVYTKGLKGLRNCNRWHCWSGHILLLIYLWCINESRQVIGSCIAFWSYRKPMALLELNFCWNFNYCISFSKKICFPIVFITYLKYERFVIYYPLIFMLSFLMQIFYRNQEFPQP
jgi:hypothetical protein